MDIANPREGKVSKEKKAYGPTRPLNDKNNQKFFTSLKMSFSILMFFKDLLHTSLYP